MADEREEFGFSPDWRGQLPFWLILPKALLFVGVPVWLMFYMITEGFLDIYVLFVIGAIAVAGGRHMAVTAEQTVNYMRRLHEGAIVAGVNGLRILPPYGEWRTFPWSEVKELRITTLHGMLACGFTTVEAGGVTCGIPPGCPQSMVASDASSEYECKHEGTQVDSHHGGDADGSGEVRRNIQGSGSEHRHEEGRGHC